MLSLRRFSFALALFLGANLLLAAPIASTGERLDETIERYRPLQCRESDSPLFQAKPNDVLQMQMIADFSHINTDTYSEDSGGDSGILSYRDEEGRWRYLPVFIWDRGNSRRDFCEWVPLRILFQSPKLKEALEKRVAGSLPFQERMVAMYQALKKKQGSKRPSKGVPQKKGLFRNLGDDIKLVTHCGKSSWRHVGGETREEQEDRLLQEYYLYQVLGQMGSAIMKTRLAEITYRDPKGNPLITRKAFFREPRSRLAKRCGLSKRPYPGVPEKGFDETSWFQLELYNRFIYFRDYGRDGRNVNKLYRGDGWIIAGPYDFDLSGIIVPTYRPNSGTVEENLKNYFRPWIAYHDGDERALVQIHFMVENREKMRHVLDQSLLRKEKKEQMLHWFDSYMAELERFLERNRVLLPALAERLEKSH